MHESDRRLLNILKRIFYHYSGAEYVYRKAVPTKKPQPHPLPTLPLWLMGIYIASFGVASQRYENKIDIIENKANTIYAQLASPDPVTKGMAFRMISDIEKMECPYKPKIKNPVSICLSFFRQSTYEGVAKLMKETVENWKGSLNSVDLSYFDLKGYDLVEANLQEANLVGANLQDANLGEANLVGASLQDANLVGASLQEANLKEASLVLANLKEANLWGTILQEANLVEANLKGVNLWGANLQKSNLGGANLQGVNLERANLQGADLRGANLWGANLERTLNLTIEQLSKVKTLYKATLDPELMKQVKEKYPHLLEVPILKHHNAYGKMR
jgi:uncharacterized protein YjbI with pentapeptide repeats